MFIGRECNRLLPDASVQLRYRRTQETGRHIKLRTVRVGVSVSDRLNQSYDCVGYLHLFEGVIAFLGRIKTERCLAEETRSSAVAERPRDASCN